MSPSFQQGERRERGRYGTRPSEGVSEIRHGRDSQGVGSWRGRPRARSANLPLRGWTRTALAGVIALGLVLISSPAMSQTSGGQWGLINGHLQKRVNGVLTLMGYTLFPDVTTSSLSITNSSSGNPAFRIAQLGGGFTVSKSFPLYLEGNAAFSRYDPTFIATNGAEQREIPSRWTTVTGTVGVGWDFPLARELVLRPIANFTIGHMETDLSAAARLIGFQTGKDIQFLEKGNLNAVGLGGSLMLDYEHYREKYEIDVEVRYTNIYLQSVPGTFEAVKGSYLAQNLNLWSRWRAPIGLTALHRPVRYVLEFTASHYFGNQDEVLGFNNLCSIGAGLELDSSYYTNWFSRVRLIGRYRFGQNVSGYTIGLGISF
jgi:hypothetical protein